MDNDIINILKEEDISKIEIALTKINNSWNITKKEIKNFKNKFSNFEIYSIQSLNYNSEYNLFKNNKEFLKHIHFVINCAEDLESKILIFGSPKNRFLPTEISAIDGEKIFIETMENIGEKCKKSEILFCIEPNSKKYNCNYITNSTEAIDLIKKINHKNICLHLDAACMYMENDFNFNKKESDLFLKHFHISEPYLNNFSNVKCNHKLFSDKLKEINYNYTKSIEMKYDEKNWKENIINSIKFSKANYF
jgi:sugar phosphate isomerase/epimerase